MNIEKKKKRIKEYIKEIRKIKEHKKGKKQIKKYREEIQKYKKRKKKTCARLCMCIKVPLSLPDQIAFDTSVLSPKARVFRKKYFANTTGLAAIILSRPDSITLLLGKEITVIFCQLSERADHSLMSSVPQGVLSHFNKPGWSNPSAT